MAKWKLFPGILSTPICSCIVRDPSYSPLLSRLSGFLTPETPCPLPHSARSDLGWRKDRAEAVQLPGRCPGFQPMTSRKEKLMAYYESVFIARQDISASQVEQLGDELVQLIQDQGGAVAKREYWGLKNLAYRIKKNRKGHYVLFSIEAPPAAVAELERVMRYNEDILRYLTVRVPELDPEPSAMMQSKHGRDDRGRGGRGDGSRRDRGPRRED